MRRAAIVRDAIIEKENAPMPHPPEIDAIGAEFDAKIDTARSAAIDSLTDLVAAGEVSREQAAILVRDSVDMLIKETINAMSYAATLRPGVWSRYMERAHILPIV